MSADVRFTFDWDQLDRVELHVQPTLRQAVAVPVACHTPDGDEVPLVLYVASTPFTPKIPDAKFRACVAALAELIGRAGEL